MKLFKFILLVVMFIAASIIITDFVVTLLTPIDSTDRSLFRRSGLDLFVDHGTGIEYLGKDGYGLIRREVR